MIHANHRNIISFVEYLVVEHRHFIVMELCKGRDLKQFIEESEEPLSEVEILKMSFQIC